MITPNNKIALITDREFERKHIPPYPRPSFFSNEHPIRIKVVLDYLEQKGFFQDERIRIEKPTTVSEKILRLSHSKYNIETIKRLSNFGQGIIGEEVFITKTTFDLAKKAIGGVIKAIDLVLNEKATQSFALVRPPGHHATKEKSSGLCIFNNIATAILYFRKEFGYEKKIAIIDIDDHFGDGIAQYFYEDPSVLYCSIHEFDFEEGDIGFISEFGDGEGLGTNINFPVPMGITDGDFVEFTSLIEPILKQFRPDLVIVAAGFDMYWSDPVGNCLLTSKTYYDFTTWILKLARDACDGKIVFVLEGGYSLTGLPICVFSVLRALLGEKYEHPESEFVDFSMLSKREEVDKIKNVLQRELSRFWFLKY
ncbi:MAG: histone deacetylase [Candidatus Lokiarchaeota archaeon]|nr:histone deacetylase [Candidatus Lokiarchaeota archaeon]